MRAMGFSFFCLFPPSLDVDWGPLAGKKGTNNPSFFFLLVFSHFSPAGTGNFSAGGNFCTSPPRPPPNSRFFFFFIVVFFFLSQRHNSGGCPWNLRTGPGPSKHKLAPGFPSARVGFFYTKIRSDPQPPNKMNRVGFFTKPGEVCFFLGVHFKKFEPFPFVFFFQVQWPGFFWGGVGGGGGKQKNKKQKKNQKSGGPARENFFYFFFEPPAGNEVKETRNTILGCSSGVKKLIPPFAK